MRSCARSLLVCLLTAVLATACGSNPGNGGDDDNPSGDADGDTISDQDEGAPDVDTDGDGTPDWQDDDSDDDDEVDELPLTQTPPVSGGRTRRRAAARPAGPPVLDR